MSRLAGTSLDPRKVANMAVTEGVNLKYVDLMRKALYAADKEIERLTGFEVMAHHFADALLEHWHAAEGDETLPSFMALAESSYAAWVEGRYADVAAAIRDDAK